MPKRKPSRAAYKLRPIARLSEYEHIVTAYAQPASGPGWGNRPLWVVVQDRRDGRMREMCIQPEDHTQRIADLYDAAAATHYAMMSAVREIVPNAAHHLRGEAPAEPRKSGGACSP